MRDIWMENRSILGPGYDRALARVGRELDLVVHETPSGDEIWAWKVPDAWDVRQAYFEANGQRFADVHEHPLHVWSHSLPFRGRVSRHELLQHITTDPDRPAAIPYDFRYYERDWGFCLEHDRLKELVAHEYDVVIDTIDFPGTLKVGEHVIQGKSDDSILIVAHLCHPAQANDDLAGVAVSIEVAKRLVDIHPRHTLRFLYLPEQIGSVAYLSRHEHLLPRFKHGIFLEMLGIDQPLVLQRSRRGDMIVDRATRLALTETGRAFAEGPFLGVILNDEQVLDGPGVDIPTVSLSRARYIPPELRCLATEPGKPYPQYHTSDDAMDIIHLERLEEAVQVTQRAIELLDADAYPQRQFRGPVQLSRHGLWVDWRVDPDLNAKTNRLMWLLEGDKSLIELAEDTEIPFDFLLSFVRRLADCGLVALSSRSVDAQRRLVDPMGETLRPQCATSTRGAAGSAREAPGPAQVAR